MVMVVSSGTGGKNSSAKSDDESDLDYETKAQARKALAAGMETQPSIVMSESGAAKLTDWAQEPTVLTLKNDLEIAKTSHDNHVVRVDHWNNLLQVKGSEKPKKVAGRSSVQPKLIRRQAEWRYSALTEPFLGSAKLYKISPSTFEDTKAAEQNELVLNWQWRTKINKVRFIDEYVRTTVDEGSVIIRVGWKRITVPIKQMVPVYDHIEIANEEEANKLQRAIELKVSDHRTYIENMPPELQAAVDFYEESGEITSAVQNGESEVTTENVIENRPTYHIVNPRNFYIDPGAGGDITKALFAVESFETCKADLLKEKSRYKNLDKVQWENATPVTDTQHASTNPDPTNGFRDTLRKKVVAHEWWGFYDINGDGTLVPIVVTWIGNVIIRMEENPFPDQKLPFVVVPYLPVKRELFGEPDAELLEDNQKILGAVSRGMIDLLARSANGQQGMAKGMLDPLNKRRFDNGQDYEFNPNMPPASAMTEHKYPEIPQSALVMLNLQNQDAEALTGVKSFSGGISGSAYGEVAAGIRGVLDAASKREMAILRRLAKGIIEIGEKTASMNAAFLSEEEVVRVTNSEFVKVRREDLAGNFDIEVDISTAEVDDAKSKDLGFMLQTLGNTMGQDMTQIILSEIAKLKKMPELAHKIANFKPEPDLMAEQMKQLQLQKEQKEIEKIQSEIDLNNAKAEEARSKKDNLDLDYVEQETGTKHARDLEKQGGQARGNQNLEITKALTKPRKEGERDPNIEAAIGFNEVSEKLSHQDKLIAAERDAPAVDDTQTRDALAGQDPRYSIGSRFYQPENDPALNPNLNM